MQFSRAAALLDEELEAWQNCPLQKIEYMFLDARYEEVSIDGAVRDCAVLIGVEILPDGHRTVLGVSRSLSEAEVHWRSFLESLLSQGMTGEQFAAKDNHSGLKAARYAVMPSVPWQRCQFHLMQNAMHYVPNVGMSKVVSDDFRDVFDSKDANAAHEEVKRLVKNTVTPHPRSQLGQKRMFRKG